MVKKALLPRRLALLWSLPVGFLLTLFFLVTPVAAAIIEGTPDADSVGGATLTITNYTVANATNILVMACLGSSAGDYLTDPTFGGQTFTQISALQNNNGAGRWFYLFKLNDAAVGTEDIVIGSGGLSDYIACGVQEYGNAIDVDSSGINPNTQATTGQLTMVTTADDGYLVGGVYADANGVSGDADTDIVIDLDGAGSRALLQNPVTGVAGSYTLDAGFNNSYFTMLGVALDPTAGGGGGTSSTTSTASLDPEWTSSMLLGLGLLLLAVFGVIGYRSLV